MTGAEPGRERRRVSPVKVAFWLALAYLAVAKWSALHPPAYAARVVGPRLDLTWPARLSQLNVTENPWFPS